MPAPTELPPTDLLHQMLEYRNGDLYWKVNKGPSAMKGTKAGSINSEGYVTIGLTWPDEPDANHWCWLGKSIDGGWEWSQTSALDIAAVQLERVLAGGGWTHWLPHYALPVPTTTETP